MTPIRPGIYMTRDNRRVRVVGVMEEQDGMHAVVYRDGDSWCVFADTGQVLNGIEDPDDLIGRVQ